MFPLLTMVGGALGASPLLIARRPGSRDLLLRIAPYQGLVGIGLLALGVVWLLRWLPAMGGSFASIGTLLVPGMIVANLALGLLLGQGLVGAALARRPAARERSETLVARITTVQVPLGLAALGMGAASYLV